MGPVDPAGYQQIEIKKENLVVLTLILVASNNSQTPCFGLKRTPSTLVKICPLCCSTRFALIAHFKSSGFNKLKRKKSVLKCVARHLFTEYIAGVSKRRVLSMG
jgi:hypothetical protein